MHRLLSIAILLVLTAPASAGDLIPRSDFFSAPNVSGVSLSPDGKRLCYAAPRDGVMNLWVAPVSDPQSGKAVTREAQRGIWGCSWSRNSAYILYSKDDNGAENDQLHAIDAASGEDRNLSNTPKAQTRIIADSASHPGELLVSINDRDPRLPDVYRIDLKSGARTLVYRNTAYTSFVADADLQLRFAVAPAKDGGNTIVRLDADGHASPYLSVPSQDALTTMLLSFDRRGRTLYALSSLGRDKAALVALDPVTGKETVIASDPRADINGWPITFAPDTGTLQAYSVEYLQYAWTVIDPAVKADFAVLSGKLQGRWDVSNRSSDDRTWLIYNDPVTASPQYLLYDRQNKTLKPLFVRFPRLAAKTLAPMQGVTFKARDGLVIPAYLTLPVGADKNGDGKPDAGPLPMVVMVHGGPWARDDYGFNPEHQWLANRGYAVLSVNYRGSSGFGKSFINAGDRQWGRAMEDDLIDAKRWAVAQGIARSDKVAIRGFSYGGYAVLAALSMHPEEFACGIDQSGPANLETLLSGVPPFLQSLTEMLARRVGDWRTEEGRAGLKAVSPLTHAAAIIHPLLIVQGSNDPRVPKAEADQIAEAMQRKGAPVTYLLYPDEGHGLARPENYMAFSAVAEAFLAAHLGGASQPIADDAKGSSQVVVMGAEQIAGLKSAP